MTQPTAITIDGHTPNEWLAMPAAEIDALVLNARPFVFKAGSAEILGSFEVVGSSLRATLAHIDGGGEGVLPTIWVLAERFARQRSLNTIEWSIHAVRCAKPNLKLRRVLERRGFTVTGEPGSETYQRTVSLSVEPRSHR